MIEIAQAAIAISMFSIATLSDLKSRSVNDSVWILFGVSGFAVNLFDGPVHFLEMMPIIGICAGISILVWHSRIIGTADLFAMLALSVTMPKFASVVFLPVLIMVEAAVIVSIYVVAMNLKNNIRDMISGTLFHDVDESVIKKTVGLFIIHKKRERERFTFPGITKVNGKTKFVFFHDSDMQEFDENADYVSMAVPLMPFFLISTTVTSIFVLFGTHKLAILSWLP